jgi:hypothetical protein
MWHYLALFRGVPVSESPFQKWVRENHKMSRYTFVPGTKIRFGQGAWDGMDESRGGDIRDVAAQFGGCISVDTTGITDSL